MLDKLVKISTLISTTTVAISLIGLWVTVADINKKDREKDIASWQQVAIYSAIQQNPSIKFDTLKDKYVILAKQLGDNRIPTGELQDSALKLALMTMLTDNLIDVSADGGYIVRDTGTYAQVMMQGLIAGVSQAQKSAEEQLKKSLEEGSRFSKHLLVMLTIVQANEGKLDETALKDEMRKSYLVDQGYVNNMWEILVLNALQSRMVYLDDAGKLRYGLGLNTVRP